MVTTVVQIASVSLHPILVLKHISWHRARDIVTCDVSWHSAWRVHVSPGHRVPGIPTDPRRPSPPGPQPPALSGWCRYQSQNWKKSRLNSETKMPKHLLKVIGSFFVDIHSTRHDRNLWSASSFQGRFIYVIIEYIGWILWTQFLSFAELCQRCKGSWWESWFLVSWLVDENTDPPASFSSSVFLMVPARKSQSRFKWLTTLAKFVTSNSLDLKNPREEPTLVFCNFWFDEQPTWVPFVPNPISFFTILPIASLSVFDVFCKFVISKLIWTNMTLGEFFHI